jgi:hypothetical protein
MEEEVAVLDMEMSQYIAYCNQQLISIDAMLGRFGSEAMQVFDFGGLPKSGRYFCKCAFGVSLPGGDPEGGVRALLMHPKAEFTQLLGQDQDVSMQPLNVQNLSPSPEEGDDLDECSDSIADSDDSDVAQELEDEML